MIAFHRIFDERDLSDPSALWTDDSVDYFLASGQTVRGAAAYYDGAEFARQIGMPPRRDWALDNLTPAGFNTVTRLRNRVINT